MLSWGKKVCSSRSVREKKCLNGGCGVPDEEEAVDGDEADSGRFSEGETEEESLIDCGLKLRKVSFIEKVEEKPRERCLADVGRSFRCLAVDVFQADRRSVCSGHAMDSSFMEEGSPTMVEKGMEPGSVFEMCDDDDENGIHDVKEGSGGGAGGAEGGQAAAAPVHPGSEGSSLRHRRVGRSAERAEAKSRRESWMDPPEEAEGNTLAQAEMESCMPTYAVRRSFWDVRWNALKPFILYPTI